MLAAYQALIEKLKEAKIEPKLHILDNECSSNCKETIRKIA